MQILKKEMKQKRLSISVLSEKIGVSKTTINNWLSGVCVPSFDNMDKLEELEFTQTACLNPSKDVEI